MPNEEKTVQEEKPQGEEAKASRQAQVNKPSPFTVGELVSISDHITEERYSTAFAAGAVEHAGWSNEDLVSKEDFIRACEEFEKVEAF